MRKVRLSEIPEAGLTLSEPLDPVAMKLQTPELKFAAPLLVRAIFQKEKDAVFVRVEAAGALECVCGRCLAFYPESYRKEFDLGYSVKGQVMLDITDDVRQEILLSYPIRFVCSEGCRGLCPGCGKNLNDEDCLCQR